jgi:GLPGLI family protein
MTRVILFFLCWCLSINAGGQITSAKITFERKTNLYKKFKHEDNIQRWVKEEDKIKIDYFELFITDSCSAYKPKESELRETNSWATSKNSVFQDLRRGTRYVIKSVWGEELHLTDTFEKRQWQISESTRKIAGYVCRKAMWKANDSTRIYAWFSYDIVPSTGPESFNGLPGTILGVATEDGGQVYFAKTVEMIRPSPADLTKPKKKKIYTIPELKAMLTKQYGHQKWFKSFMYNQFGIW